MEKEIHIFKLLEDFNKYRLHIFIISLSVFLIAYFMPLNYFNRINAKINIEQKNEINIFKEINELVIQVSNYQMFMNDNTQLSNTGIFSEKFLNQTYMSIPNKSLIRRSYYDDDNQSIDEFTAINSLINRFFFEEVNDIITIQFQSSISQLDNDLNFLKQLVSIENKGIKKKIDKLLDNYLISSKNKLKTIQEKNRIDKLLSSSLKEKNIARLKNESKIAKSLNINKPANLALDPDIIIGKNLDGSDPIRQKSYTRPKSYTYVDGHIVLDSFIKYEEDLLANQNKTFDVLNVYIKNIEESLELIEKLYANNSSDIENILYLDISSIILEENDQSLIFSLILYLVSICVMFFFIAVRAAYQAYKVNSLIETSNYSDKLNLD